MLKMINTMRPQKAYGKSVIRTNTSVFIVMTFHYSFKSITPFFKVPAFLLVSLKYYEFKPFLNNKRLFHILGILIIIIVLF